MSEDKIFLDSTIFWVFALLSVSSALGVVLHRSIIYAALFLIVVFMSIAGIFVLNNADFLAISQVIVYGVGLTIILIFGVMFTGDREFQSDASIRNRNRAFWIVGLMAGATLLFGSTRIINSLVLPFWSAAFQDVPPDMVTGIQQTLIQEGSTRMLGSVLFQKYALPFEVASVLLLVALVGAIVLAKKKFEFAEDVLGETKFPINVESELNPEAETEFETKFKHHASLPVQEETKMATQDDDDNVSDETSEMAGVK